MLGLDVSGSVDAREYRLQLDGLAAALTDPQVQEALLAFPGDPVAIAVFEWSAASYQRVLVDWRLLTGPDEIGAVAAALEAERRQAAPQATGIGAALIHAEKMLNRAPPCWRWTVDISGDGTNNDFPQPWKVYREGVLAGVTVNALAVGQDRARDDDRRKMSIGALMAYYRRNLVRGPGAFVEPAIGYEDFATAMKRKLLREISGVAVGGGAPAQATRLAGEPGLQ